MAINSVDPVSFPDLPARMSQRAPGTLPGDARDKSVADPSMPEQRTPESRAAEHPDIQIAPGLSLRFRVDADTGKTVASVVNPNTGEVVRQIPSEDALALAKSLGKMQGLVLDLKV